MLDELNAPAVKKAGNECSYKSVKFIFIVYLRTLIVFCGKSPIRFIDKEFEFTSAPK